jgi:hypothetical protein
MEVLLRGALQLNGWRSADIHQAMLTSFGLSADSFSTSTQVDEPPTFSCAGRLQSAGTPTTSQHGFVDPPDELRQPARFSEPRFQTWESLLINKTKKPFMRFFFRNRWGDGFADPDETSKAQRSTPNNLRTRSPPKRIPGAKKPSFITELVSL